MRQNEPAAAVEAGGKKKRSGPKRKQSKGVLCSVPDCGRPAYARGHCQTHHRHLLTTGKVRTIRPYRERTEGTVKFAGLRLTRLCADRIREYADERGMSLGAAIADVLQGWIVKGKRPVPRRHRAKP